MNHIAEWPPESFKCNLNRISVSQPNPRSKAQAVGSEEMHMHITRPAMSFELEVMVLEIPQAMAHFRFARAEGSRPENTPVTFDPHMDRHRGKLRIHNQLRSKS